MASFDGAQEGLLRGEICENDLPSTVKVLRAPNGARVYLVGTAHYSEESCRDVEQTIQLTHPDFVMLELCTARFRLLEVDAEELLEQAREGMSIARFRMCIQQHGTVGGLLQVLLVILSERLTKQLEMPAGGEFRAGYREAQKISYCRVHLGDRPIAVTLKRAMASLSLWQKIRVAWHFLTDVNITKEEVEKLKEQDILEKFMGELGQQFPPLMEVLVRERDRYLAFQLQALCQQEPLREVNNVLVPFNGEPLVVVGVVGMGHVNGIAQHWDQKIDDIVEISRVPPTPPKSVAWNVIKKVAFAAVISYGAYRLHHALPESWQLTFPWVQ